MQKTLKLEQDNSKSLFSLFQGSYSVPKLESKLERPKYAGICRVAELMDLAWVLYCLALNYQFSWVEFWPNGWDDWPWINTAMEQTFIHLKAGDKSVVREFYEAFTQKVEYCDEILILS